MATEALAVTTSTTTGFPSPIPSASLLLSFRPTSKKVLILGSKRLAASRLFTSLEADVRPVLVGVDCGPEGSLNTACDEVRWRVQQNQAEWKTTPSCENVESWTNLIDQVDGHDRGLFAVCITDTLHAGDADAVVHVMHQGQSKVESTQKKTLLPLDRAKLVVAICRSKRIPVNVADKPELCDFSFPASHRFLASPSPLEQQQAPEQSTGPPSQVASPLQIAVTTNGKGCRLAGRIRREIVACLPKNVGDAVERVGEMRELAKRDSSKSSTRSHLVRRMAQQKNQQDARGGDGMVDVEEEDLSFDNTPINSPVPQLSMAKENAGDGFFAKLSNELEQNEISRNEQEQEQEKTKRRMRWVAQMSEYWPIEYLGSMSASDMARALDTYKDEKEATAPSNAKDRDETPRGRGRERLGAKIEVTESSSAGSRRGRSQHSLSISRPPLTRQQKGQLFLLGSGTGHPGLLTTFARDLLTSSETDLILSDKLVPASILGLIPRHIPLTIARKFPGNAEGAQSELIALALEGAKAGKRVVRLKQGDPFVYGRGGEEVLAFRKEGFACTVVPGISSALAAPLMLGIPVTQRGAADSLTLCTGVGRGGKSVKLQGYERSRSLVILMGVARLGDVVKTLTQGWTSALQGMASYDETSSGGSRGGAAFPPYTPIAIIERASSHDQRLVASTLAEVESSLQRCGEQRPPGMMLVGWSVLSLEGKGNVDILDDENACEGDDAELERRDRSRVQRWLGDQTFVVKEGLDDGFTAYAKGIANVAESKSKEAINTAADAMQDRQRGRDGWAAPRYGEEGPRGGWGEKEKPL